MRRGIPQPVDLVPFACLEELVIDYEHGMRRDILWEGEGWGLVDPDTLGGVLRGSETPLFPWLTLIWRPRAP